MLPMTTPAPTDERGPADPNLLLLIRRAAAGDRAAFEAIIRVHERRVLMTALRLLGNMDDAQDAGQDVFIWMHRYLPRFDSAKPLSPWVYRMTVNVCRDHWQRSKRNRTENLVNFEVPSEATPHNDPHRSLRAREDRTILYRALDTLPPKERAAIVLRDIEGLSTAEVADVLESSPVTVRSQISAARLKIKKAIERMEKR